MNRPIALLTDFGSADYYAGVLRGSIKKQNPGAHIIDLGHDVCPHSIVNGQFILASSIPFFPEGTVFCVVIDPGVGSSRKGIIARDKKNSLYVMPDNGLVSAVPDIVKIFAIDEAPFHAASSTFHGRDIFGPAAAMVAEGTPPEEIGTPWRDPVIKDFPPFEKKEGVLTGSIIHIDIFGNAVTSIPAAEINASPGNTITADINGKELSLPFVHTYSEIPGNACALLEGSSGFLEIAARESSAAEKLSLHFEGRITLRHE